jgi:EAL domain-containing protein (putative c-di-GMP-specific phosphodiesterase class I)
MHRPKLVDDAISIDEVGIESGRYRGLLLRSAYQPIFRRDGGVLVPFAVEGLIVPYADGGPVPPARLFENAPPEDRMFVESMCRALHMRNYHNIGVPCLELFFNFDPHVNCDLAASIRQIRFMARRLREIGFNSRLLVCEITEASALSDKTLVRLAAEMRRHGIRLAIDDFGTGHSTLERVEMIEPDIVKIDGGWFRQITATPASVRLFPSLVQGFKDRGSHVLVEGVETPYQLRVALDGGADLLQGYLLGRPAAAGTIFSTEPLEIDALAGDEQKVVRLFR